MSNLFQRLSFNYRNEGTSQNYGPSHLASCKFSPESKIERMKFGWIINSSATTAFLRNSHCCIRDDQTLLKGVQYMLFYFCKYVSSAAGAFCSILKLLLSTWNTFPSHSLGFVFSPQIKYICVIVKRALLSSQIAPLGFDVLHTV